MNALIYYKGLLSSGHFGGSIKVLVDPPVDINRLYWLMWEIREQSAKLVLDKENKKEVTCFSLLDQGDGLLSSSADRTIRMCRMVQRKLECIEVICMKDPVRHVYSQGQLIFVVAQTHGIKVMMGRLSVINIPRSFG